jgi:hypothetical protein
MLTRSASFGVARVGVGPEGAQTGKPRATPWGKGNSRESHALKELHMLRKRRAAMHLSRPFRAPVTRHDAGSQGVALG